jgi:hypothetical protein
VDGLGAISICPAVADPRKCMRLLNASSLDASTTAVAAAAQTLIVGRPDGSLQPYWSEIPSFPSSYSVHAGTALAFRYTTGHNVWLLPTEQAYARCDFSSAAELAGQAVGGGASNTWHNEYRAVATQPGLLLVACEASFASHCSRGQKVRVTVLPSNVALPSPPPTPPVPPTSDAPPPTSPPEPNPSLGEDRDTRGAIIGSLVGATIVIVLSASVCLWACERDIAT